MKSSWNVSRMASNTIRPVASRTINLVLISRSPHLDSVINTPVCPFQWLGSALNNVFPSLSTAILPVLHLPRSQSWLISAWSHESSRHVRQKRGRGVWNGNDRTIILPLLSVRRNDSFFHLHIRAPLTLLTYRCILITLDNVRTLSLTFT